MSYLLLSCISPEMRQQQMQLKESCIPSCQKTHNTCNNSLSNSGFNPETPQLRCSYPSGSWAQLLEKSATLSTLFCAATCSTARLTRDPLAQYCLAGHLVLGPHLTSWKTSRNSAHSIWNRVSYFHITMTTMGGAIRYTIYYEYYLYNLENLPIIS